MTQQEPILQVSHLKKYFKTPKGMLHAVDDVSFTIDKGKTLGVFGEETVNVLGVNLDIALAMGLVGEISK